jgi:hypothetical protein
VTYFWGTLGWIWSKRKFLAVTCSAALLFFVWFFPFSDLSDLVTSAVARGTGNQIYLQFETMKLNLLPTPAISANRVSVETPALPPIEAAWLKISPSWFSLLFNAWTFKKAAAGDPEAAAKLQTRLGLSIAAEGVLGGDLDASLSSGSKSESGNDRSRVALAIDKVNLSEVRKWADLSMDLQGQASLETHLQFTPGFTDQPDGEIELHVNKFNLPATTLMIPFEGAMMPINLPTLTLGNVILRGRLSGGSLVIEEGTFGQSKDPINGRIKGQLALRLVPMGGGVQPVFGAYNLTVDLNTSKQVDKEMGFAFLLFDSAKTPTATGSHYLFRAQGQGIGPAFPPPSIARINSF